MKLFDTHCDTLYEIYRGGGNICENPYNISLKAAGIYEKYTQVLGIWSNTRLSDDENFAEYKEIIKNLKSELAGSEKYENFSYHLAVEGGKLISDDMSRLYELKKDGVKLLTVVYKGECKIGGGSDTDAGLTPFGKDVIKECGTLGIIPDLSHSSDRSFYDTAELAAKYGLPIMATHSNSRAVRNCDRNLTDDMFKTVRIFHGTVGISLFTPHLCDEPEKCGIDDIVRHIDRYMELGGEDTVCMGCDFDGVGDALPQGISGIADIVKIKDRLLNLGYSERICDKIFYGNANEFFSKYVK